MGHKRYITKNDRVYGPYLYEGYRSKDGKVRKRYLGIDKDIKKGNIPLIVIIILIMLFSLFMLFRLFLHRFF